MNGSLLGSAAMMGGSAPVITSAPVLTWTVEIGSSPSIAPGSVTGSGVTNTFTLKRDGVAVTGVIGVSEAALEAYVAVAADTIALALTVDQISTNAFGSDTETSNTEFFAPNRVASNFFWLNPSVPSVGAVASIADSINGISTVAQAGTVSKSASGFGGSYNAFTFPGSANLKASTGPHVSGTTALTATFAGLWGASAAVLLEQTVNAPNNNNSWAIFTNSPASTNLNGRSRGNGAGESSRHAVFSNSSKVVVSIGWNMTLTGSAQVVFIRKNGVAQTLTAHIASAVAGTFGNADLYIGARGLSGTDSLTGEFGHIILSHSNSQNNGLESTERYSGVKAGITW